MQKNPRNRAEEEILRLEEEIQLAQFGRNPAKAAKLERIRRDYCRRLPALSRGEEYEEAAR